jgi:PAS domain S-box-containing protein
VIDIHFSAPSQEQIRCQASLLDTMSEGVVVRQGNRVLYANKAMYRMLGLSEVEGGDFISQRIDSWVHIDDRESVEKMYAARIEGTEDVSYEYNFRIVKPNAEIVWVTCRPRIVDWCGAPAVAAHLSDITHEKELLSKGQLSKDLFRNIFNVTPEFMILFKLSNGDIIDVNPAFLNIFGRRRDEVKGVSLEKLDIASDPTFHGRFIEELKTTSFITDVPAALKTRAGIIRHFRLFARKIEGDSEPYLLMTGRDVTDEISKAQELQRNRDAAELSNRTKSEFLANMSHELRTPLNAILGFSELIRDQIGGANSASRYSEYAGDIHKSGTHLLSIINDILDLSKIEAGRLEAYLEWMDPSGSLEMCLRLVQQRANESRVNIERVIDPNIQLCADERILKQIGINLLSNAVKFTNPLGTVTLGLELCEDGSACLYVTDTGIGMTADEITIARRPFGQVDSTLNRSNLGSGLGLPLVVAFSEKLGCKFVLESQPDVGTNVRIYFPADKVRRQEASEQDDDFI